MRKPWEIAVDVVGIALLGALVALVIASAALG
jgi:hypothetical protein